MMSSRRTIEVGGRGDDTRGACLARLAAGRQGGELEFVIPERRESLTVGGYSGSGALPAAMIRGKVDLRQTPADVQRRILHRRALRPLAGRATHSAIPAPAQSRAAVASGEPSGRRGIFPAVKGDRSLRHLALRPELGGTCAREVAYRLPGLHRLVALHGSNHEATNGRAFGKATRHSGEVFRDRGK